MWGKVLRIFTSWWHIKWFQRAQNSTNRYPVRSSSGRDLVRGQSDIKGGQLFSQTGEKGWFGGEEQVGLKRKIEMTRWISRSVTLCNRRVAGIHPPQKREGQDTLHGLQWDFSNYLLLHIWMRWALRGLEACAALRPSENHLWGDFKNIPVMLQDKSLITGNYGLPILQSPPPPLSFPFWKRPFASPPPLLSRHTTGKAESGRGGYYLGAATDHGHGRFTALPFMWSGSLVGRNYRPNDPN